MPILHTKGTSINDLGVIQDLMVVLYPPRGLLTLTIPWANTTPRAFQNLGWTHRFMNTFFRGGTKGVP